MEHSHAHRGFTLIELLIVSGIIVVITGIVFVNQSTFNKTLILSNTAYDIALSIQAAETYGMGGHSVGISPVGYGLHFDSNFPKEYKLFADISPQSSSGSACHAPGNTQGGLDAQPGNCVYDAGNDSLVLTYGLGNGISISEFCAYPAWGKYCASTGLTSLDVVFSRPNAAPLISTSGAYTASAKSACLAAISPQGGIRSVVISASGEIEVRQTACP